MDLLDKIIITANELRESGNYKIASSLYSVITDLAMVEERRLIKGRLAQAHQELVELKANLNKVALHKLASDIDIIARDIENRLISFRTDDPIESVLDSYKALHRIASTGTDTSNILNDLRGLVENESLSDKDFQEEFKKRTIGLTDNDRTNLSYVLEKDYNLPVMFDKTAQVADKTISDKEKAQQDCLDKAKTPKEKAKCLEGPQDGRMKMFQSWPTAPNIWSGFAYETVVPYSQNSQLNFWTLAGIKPLTRKTAESEYVSEDGCPKCYSMNVTTGDPYKIPYEIGFHMKCNDCKHTWDEPTMGLDEYDNPV